MWFHVKHLPLGGLTPLVRRRQLMTRPTEMFHVKHVSSKDHSLLPGPYLEQHLQKALELLGAVVFDNDLAAGTLRLHAYSRA